MRRAGTTIEYEDDDEDLAFATPVQSPAKSQLQSSALRHQEPSPPKLPLKLVMDPRGVIKDFESAQKNVDIQTTQLMTSEKCNELMSTLLDTSEKG